MFWEIAFTGPLPRAAVPHMIMQVHPHFWLDLLTALVVVTGFWMVVR
jgi:hypothetical protein